MQTSPVTFYLFEKKSSLHYNIKVSVNSLSTLRLQLTAIFSAWVTLLQDTSMAPSFMSSAQISSYLRGLVWPSSVKQYLHSPSPSCPISLVHFILPSTSHLSTAYIFIYVIILFLHPQDGRPRRAGTWSILYPQHLE